jgi:hypothetical protein
LAHTAFAETSFSIDHQSCGDTGTSRLCGNIELVQFSALQHAKANRRISHSGDPDIRQGVPKSLSEVLARAQPSELRRYDSSVRVLPSVIPDLRQLLDLG